MNTMKIAMNNQSITQNTHNTPNPNQNLRVCNLILDGNAHRDLSWDLDLNESQNLGLDFLSEAMLPEIRTIATLIASDRHSFQTNQLSPSRFTDECDWFASRILVLNIRIFHFENMDMMTLKMLHQANQRAEKFAKKHQIQSFQAAKIQLNCSQKQLNQFNQSLMISCEIASEMSQNIFTNTQNLRKNLPEMVKFK